MKNLARRQNYIKQVVLNELIIGQDINYVKSVKDNNLNLNYNINFDNLYMAIIGVPREIYSLIYNCDATKYLYIFDKTREFLKEKFEGNKHKVEVFLNLYSDSRKVIIMITPNKKNDYNEIKDIVMQANRYMNNLFFENIENFDVNHFHLGAITNHIKSWNDIKNEFEKIDFCSYLSFFTDELEIIDSESYYEMLTPFSYIDLNKITKEIIDNIELNNIEEIKNLCDKLFLEKLKKTFDKNLCEEILLKFKMEILNRIAYTINDLSEIDKILCEKTYYKIEEMNESVKEILIKVSNQMTQNYKEYNEIIKRALDYIHENYHKKVLLADIAEYAKVVPQHLSKVFNKEMNISIPIYINGLRVEKAKRLLRCTNMKASMVSEKSGFESPRRFGQIFKEHTGITPLEYRKDIICNECPNI